ncbi:hypothetical protein ACH4RG_28760 [Streptomyces sp. NPDC021019]|uniref:hypothetical protein n=1 Tax=Streptomyces sp. NPDC021019 TaxID=3365108 RepID=UPI0037A519F3
MGEEPGRTECPGSLLAELDPGTPAIPAVIQSATASGSSRVYQPGRDPNADQR